MRRFLPLVLPLVFLVACSEPAVPAQPLAPPPAPLACTRFEAVRLFDGTQVTPSTSVVVQDGRIKEVGGTTACRTNVPGAGKTLLPGLIDSHAHVWGDEHLAMALRFGVTTVLDMLTDPKAAQALREEAAKRNDIADIKSAGYAVTAKGGHGTEYGMAVPTLDKPEDAEDFVASRVADKSDYLKIIYQPGSTMFKSISKDTLKAAVDAAHRHHLMAVVHIDTLQGASDAIGAGADGLAHLFYDTTATPDFIKLLKTHDAFVVPTLSVLRTITGKPHGADLVADARLRPKLDDEDVKGLTATFPAKIPVDEAGIAASVRAFHAAGVPILAGTDSPNPGTAHGVSLHGELELLVLDGLTPSEALASATAIPANRFSLRDRGRIQPGMRADLLLVDGDPTTDIKATRAIAGVWRGGERLADTPLVPKKPRPVAKVDAVKRAPGVISDFEGKEISAKYGLGWRETTDVIAGGKSTAAIKLEKGSLAVSGTVDGALPFAWSGVMFNPGDQLFAPADMSAAKELVFKARGDEKKSYVVMVFTKKGGPMPARQPFVAPKKWKEQHIALSAFGGTDGSDIVGIAFVESPAPGKYAFSLDDVELR